MKMERRVSFFGKMRLNGHILLIALAVIMIWRGVWGLLDVYLFPEKPTLSFLLSIVIGLSIMLVDDRKIEELKGK